jgi:DNA replication and repair protein RecF
VSAQRNAWLRSGGRGHPIWDEEYSSLLTLIANARARFFANLSRDLTVLLRAFPSVAGVVPQWRAEFPADGSVLDLLRETLSADIERGYSYVSPARADFAFLRDGNRWVGSRGQNKLLGMLMQLAAERCCPSGDGERPIWLVDDPGSELDEATLDAVLPMLQRSGDQILVASLSAPSMEVTRTCAPELFHVEHGALHRS